MQPIPFAPQTDLAPIVFDGRQLQLAKEMKKEEEDFTLRIDAVHAGRLVWFGLAERKEQRSGLYRVTKKGVRFLKGLEKVPRRIYTSKGCVVDQDEEMVSVYDVKNVVLDKEYWDNYPMEH